MYVKLACLPSFWHFLSDLLQNYAKKRIDSMNRDSFFKFQNESGIDDSRKFENRAYPTKD